MKKRKKRRTKKIKIKIKRKEHKHYQISREQSSNGDDVRQRATVRAYVPLCVSRQRARERWGREGWGVRQKTKWGRKSLRLDIDELSWVREWGLWGRVRREWWESDQLGLGLFFRDQNDVVLGEKSTNLKPGINRFNLWFFRFLGWTERFLLFTVFLVISGFL